MISFSEHPPGSDDEFWVSEWKHAVRVGSFVAEEEKDGGLDDSYGGDRQEERLWSVGRVYRAQIC